MTNLDNAQYADTVSAGEPVRVLAIESAIVCRDLPRLLGFCTGCLGFAVYERFDVPGVGAIVKMNRDAARVKLFRPATEVHDPVEANPWTAPGGWRYVTVHLDSVAGVDSTAAAAADGGAKILIEPQSYRPGSYVTLFADIEQNVWEFMFSENLTA